MTKKEKVLFEWMVNRISCCWTPFDNYDVEEEWKAFYNMVFQLNPESEVLMKYLGNLFDLVEGR